MPAWFAAIVHVPAATLVTVLPLTVHLLVVVLVNVTARPEVAVALAVVVGPPTARVAGVKVKPIVPMVWLALPTVKP